MAISPQEFNPEFTDELLKRLMGGIGEREGMRVGQARSEALSRGLEGDIHETGAVAGVRAGADLERGNTEADLRYRLAGMGREERLGREQRGYEVEDRNFGAAEAQKNRDNQYRMALLGYDQERDMEGVRNRRGYQSQLYNLGGYGAGLALKSLF